MAMLLCAGKLAAFQGICCVIFSVFPVVSNCIRGLDSELLGGVSHVSHWDWPQVRIFRVWKHLVSVLVDAVEFCGKCASGCSSILWMCCYITSV